MSNYRVVAVTRIADIRVAEIFHGRVVVEIHLLPDLLVPAVFVLGGAATLSSIFANGHQAVVPVAKSSSTITKGVESDMVVCEGGTNLKNVVVG